MKAGDRAERIAAAYLEGKGLAVIESRYRCRWGEIDLILRDRDTLVFAEVRLRHSKDFGGAAYSVDRRKQARIIATARHYLGARGSRRAGSTWSCSSASSLRKSSGYATRSPPENGLELAVEWFSHEAHPPRRG
jgi:putative endonuclease